MTYVAMVKTAIYDEITARLAILPVSCTYTMCGVEFECLFVFYGARWLSVDISDDGVLLLGTTAHCSRMSRDSPYVLWYCSLSDEHCIVALCRAVAAWTGITNAGIHQFEGMS
jgi:hypothetical protein